MKHLFSKYLAVIIALIALFSSCSTSAFFYAPTKEFVHYPDTAIYTIEELNFKASDGCMLNGWFLKPKNKTMAIIATVLQLHGNGGNISYQYQFAEPLIKAGFQVMVFDYEGYGKSTGKASQEKVLDDGIQALHYIKQREDVKNTKLILFGQSLGGHLSCVVAAKEQQLIDALVVEGAFTGHRTMAVYVAHNHNAPKWVAKLLVKSKYNAIDYIDKVTIPKLIIHSTEDATCPFYMGKELYNKAVSPKYFWEIKGPHIQASQLYSDEFVKHFKDIINKNS
jgi:alpha-beta hydrolase superfamily lysophospholipase